MSVINVVEVLVALAVIYATYWFFPEAGMIAMKDRRTPL